MSPQFQCLLLHSIRKLSLTHSTAWAASPASPTASEKRSWNTSNYTRYLACQHIFLRVVFELLLVIDGRAFEIVFSCEVEFYNSVILQWENVVVRNEYINTLFISKIFNITIHIEAFQVVHGKRGCSASSLQQNSSSSM